MKYNGCVGSKPGYGNTYSIGVGVADGDTAGVGAGAFRGAATTEVAHNNEKKMIPTRTPIH